MQIRVEWIRIEPNYGLTLQEACEKGKKPILENNPKPHLHPNPRTGSHIVWQVAGALTFSHYAVEGNPYSETAGGWLDLINPLSLPNDIHEIIDVFNE